jgi:predicted MFS family arabinose efflux permease
MVVLALVLWRSLPVDRADARRPYLQMLISVPVLLKEEPVILLRSLYGAAAFGAFNALWTPLAFLLSGSPYHYSTSTIGLFGLFGIAGALTASAAGHVADRGHAGTMTMAASAVMLLSWIPIAFGRHSLTALIAGVVVLDFAVQGLHITNQSIIYQLRPEARSRITSAYMALYFTGGVVGSVVAATAYSAGGWQASSAVGAAFGLMAVLLWIGTAVRARLARPGTPVQPVGSRS